MEKFEITSSTSESLSLKIFPYMTSESRPEVKDLPNQEWIQRHHTSDELVELVIVGNLYAIDEIVDGMYARTKSTEFDEVDQSWFWTEQWQEGERAVQEHIRNGEVESFDSMDEFLSTLDDDDE